MTNQNNTLELKILPRVVLCVPRPNDIIQKQQSTPFLDCQLHTFRLLLLVLFFALFMGP